jgi:hypothetical protein
MSDMFRPLNGHYQEVTTVIKRHVHMSNAVVLKQFEVTYDVSVRDVQCIRFVFARFQMFKMYIDMCSLIKILCPSVVT